MVNTKISVVILLLVIIVISSGCDDQNMSGDAFKGNIPTPSVKNIENSINKDFPDINQAELLSSEPEYAGYILKLPSDSMIKKEIMLDKQVSQRAMTIKKKGIELKEQKEKLIQEHSLTKSLLNNLGIDNSKIEYEYNDVFNGMSLDISNEKAEELKEMLIFSNLEKNYIVKANLDVSVPLINADDVWLQQDNQGNYITGEGIKVAIIDTGIDYTHPDLGGCFGEGCKVVGGYDFINDDNDPMDDHMHGTHCAGIVAGNGVLNGVAPGAELYAYKVLDSAGSGALSGIVAALERVVDPNQDGDFSDKMDVLSMSFGMSISSPEDYLSTVCDDLMDLGIVTVIAAGNSGAQGYYTIGSPGTSRKAITIGASYEQEYESFSLDCNPGEMTHCGECSASGTIICDYFGDAPTNIDQIAYYSSKGPTFLKNELGYAFYYKPDVVAPGSLICSARYDSVFPEGQSPYYCPCIDDQHLQLMGTSMATPHVAGMAALIKQKHPNWSAEEIKVAIKNSAIDMGLEKVTQGTGRVDALPPVLLENPPCIAELFDIEITEDNQINFIGNAKGENFDNYYIYKKLNNEWNLLGTFNEEKNMEILFTCPEELLEYGYNYFSIVVVSNTGEITEDYLTLNIESKLFVEFSISEIESLSNNNGILEPGETFNLNIQLTNERLGLENIYLNLETDYEGTIIENEELINNGVFIEELNNVFETNYQITVDENFEGNNLEIIWQVIENNDFLDGGIINVLFNEKPLFEEIRQEFESMSPNGIGVFDFNNDNQEDILSIYGCSLYSEFKGIVSYQRENSEFEINSQSSFADLIWPQGISFADINNDGYLDFSIADAYLGPKIYINNQGESFDNFDLELNNYLPLTTYTIWTDYNNDGFVDLVVGSSIVTYLFENLNGEEFVDVTDEIGLNEVITGPFIGEWSDIDNNGAEDTFIYNAMILNTGNNLFDVLNYPDLGVLSSICFNDLDQDGDFDILGQGKHILKNNIIDGNESGPLTFEDITENSFLDEPHDILWAQIAWLDINNDGFEDFIMTGSFAGHLYPEGKPSALRIYVNNQEGVFEDKSDFAGNFIYGQAGSGIASFDYDGDGLIDILWSNVDSVNNMRLLRNLNQDNNNYIKFKLEGTISNRAAIGAKLYIHTPDGRMQLKRIYSGNGNSQSSLMVHFGVGTNEIIDNVEIHWPSGVIQTLTDVAVNQMVMVTEEAELCSEGTPYNQCSTSQPVYCDEGELINDCRRCDCPSNQICNIDGSCSDLDILLGDVDSDGIIVICDAALVLQYVVRGTTDIGDLNGEQLVAADVDCNGQVQAYDAALIYHYVVNLIDEFPCTSGRFAETVEELIACVEQIEVTRDTERIKDSLSKCYEEESNTPKLTLKK